MFPALQASTLPWILTQVANCGVSECQPPDTLQHFLTHDLPTIPGLLCGLPLPNSLHCPPDTDWHCLVTPRSAQLVPQENIATTHLGSSHLSTVSSESSFTATTSSSAVTGPTEASIASLGSANGEGNSADSLVSRVVGIGSAGGNEARRLEEESLKDIVLPDLTCPPPTHGRNQFWLKGPNRMVVSPSVQPTLTTIIQSDKNNNNSNSYTKGKNYKTRTDNHWNNNNNSNNNKQNYSNNNNSTTTGHKNKGTATKRPPEPHLRIDESEGEHTEHSEQAEHSEQVSQPPVFKYEVDLRIPEDQERQCHRGKQTPCKAVDAKEVEKLLQDALWKGTQQEEKRSDVSEGGSSSSSGGCDTGYSSRCSTPPGPLTLSSEAAPHTHTTSSSDHDASNAWDGHTQSLPSSSSATTTTTTNNNNSHNSQGLYHNNRQKRRNNSSTTSGGSNNTSNSSYNSTSHHEDFHKYHIQQFHQPNHQVRPMHNHLFHHQYHHQNHHHNQGNNSGNGGSGGGSGFIGNQYSHHYPNFIVRDNQPFQNRRYDRNYERNHDRSYNFGGQYNNHFYNTLGDLPPPPPPPHGWYNNSGRFHNRYSNHSNGYVQRNDSSWDGSKPLVDPAGTFTAEYKGDPRWKSEVVETPKQLLDGSEWDGLSQQVWDMFKQHQQTNKTFGQKMKVKEKVLRAIRNVRWVQAVIPHCRLYVVGSSLSGFGADWSDVDMCLMVATRDLDQRTEAMAILRILQRELNHCPFVEKMELIRAKVPILKFRDAQTKVEVDLNCNNSVGIRNTHLLNSYSQLDWRVRPLVLVVKLWAQRHNINNAKDMTISSYSLVLMVIHYLQKGVEPPVLPCLQKIFPEKFRSHGPVTNIMMTEKMPTFTSKNTLSLGQLFHGFLDHFANKFKFIEETISVRTGGLVPTSHCRSVPSSKNDSRMWKYLCIEEPFDLTNTARSVYDEDVFKRVRKVFTNSYTLLDETRNLSSIMGDVKL